MAGCCGFGGDTGYGVLQRLGNFFGLALADNKRRGEQNVIAGATVDTTLGGVDGDVALECGCADALGYIRLGRKWLARRRVAHEFDAQQETLQYQTTVDMLNAQFRLISGAAGGSFS